MTAAAPPAGSIVLDNADLQLKCNMVHFNSTAFAVDTKIQLDFGEIGIERLRRHRLLAVSRQQS